MKSKAVLNNIQLGDNRGAGHEEKRSSLGRVPWRSDDSPERKAAKDIGEGHLESRGEATRDTDDTPQHEETDKL